MSFCFKFNHKSRVVGFARADDSYVKQSLKKKKSFTLDRLLIELDMKPVSLLPLLNYRSICLTSRLLENL